AELAHQRVHVLGPDHLLALIAFDQHVGGAGVAPIVQHDAVPARGELLRQRNELVMAASAACREHDPRATLADLLPVDVDSADVGDGHGPLAGLVAHVDAARLPHVGATWIRGSAARRRAAFQLSKWCPDVSGAAAQAHSGFMPDSLITLDQVSPSL